MFIHHHNNHFYIITQTKYLTAHNVYEIHGSTDIHTATFEVQNNLAKIKNKQQHESLRM